MLKDTSVTDVYDTDPVLPFPNTVLVLPSVYKIPTVQYNNSEFPVYLSVEVSPEHIYCIHVWITVTFDHYWPIS